MRRSRIGCNELLAITHGVTIKLLTQQVPAEAVLRMINARLEKVTMQYQHARGGDNKIEAEAMAETKWQLAELKMQFADLLVEQVEAGLRRDG